MLEHLLKLVFWWSFLILSGTFLLQCSQLPLLHTRTNLKYQSAPAGHPPHPSPTIHSGLCSLLQLLQTITTAISPLPALPTRTAYSSKSLDTDSLPLSTVEGNAIYELIHPESILFSNEESRWSGRWCEVGWLIEDTVTVGAATASDLL